MLRTLKNGYLLPKLLGFKAVGDGAAVVASFGALLGTYTDEGSGVQRLALRNSFHRLPVFVAGPGVDTTDGAFVALPSDPTVAQLEAQLLDSGGSGESGAIHALALGWMSSSDDPCALKQAVKCCLDGGRYIGGHFDASEEGFSLGHADFKDVAKTATGVFTFTFRKGFGSAPVVVATMSGGHGSYRVHAVSSTSVTIKTYSVAGAAADRDFYLHVYGTKSLAEQCYDQARRALKVSGRKVELIALKVTVTGGVPVLTYGGDDATITDTGTGDFLITLTRARAKTLIPIAMSDLRTWIGTVDTDSLQVLTGNAAGAATDPTDIHILVLATDDANEYYQE